VSWWSDSAVLTTAGSSLHYCGARTEELRLGRVMFACSKRGERERRTRARAWSLFGGRWGQFH